MDKEQLLQRLEKYMDAIEGGASKAGEFLVEQTPLVAQEFLAWEFWQAAMGVLLFLVLGLAGASFMYRSAPQARKAFDSADPSAEFFTFIYGAIVLMLSTPFFCMNFHDAAKVKIAPRVVLIEKIAELRK